MWGYDRVADKYNYSSSANICEISCYKLTGQFQYIYPLVNKKLDALQIL